MSESVKFGQFRSNMDVRKCPRVYKTRTFGHVFGHDGGRQDWEDFSVAKAQRVVYKQQPTAIPELEPANLETDLAKRMANLYGVEWLRVMRTMQKRFDAKLLYHEDQDGTVGKKPYWADLD